MPLRPTLLVDGNNLLVRAVEATRHSSMTSPDGIDTSALVSFVATLSRHTRDEQPYRVIVCWDAGYEWRTSLYPDYKANRPTAPDPYRQTSRTLTMEFLDLARVPQVKVDGYEADDVIAAYWRRATAPVTILSNDKDLMQLVGTTPTGQPCTQIRLSSYATATDYWDATRVTEHYGCTPEQLPMVMSLTGDSSDNIPGVKGIGPKFALKHLTAAGWDLNSVTHAGIAEARDTGDVAIYRQLVDLRDGPDLDVPTMSPFMPTTYGPDLEWDELAIFLKRLALKKIERDLYLGQLW
jgi:DNA polymerase-1